MKKQVLMLAIFFLVIGMAGQALAIDEENVGVAATVGKPGISSTVIFSPSMPSWMIRSVTIVNAGATGAYIPSVTPSWNTKVWESAHLEGQFTFTFDTPAPSAGYVRWTITPAA